MRGIISTLPMLSVIDSNVIEIEKKGVIHNGMSLFQDLKLKRRKVDSRCSSDGESIGTSESASSLSPDGIQSEGSPKQDKDRCLTPEDLVPPPIQSKGAFQPQIYFMIKAESRNKVPYNNNNNHIHNNNNNSKPTTNGVNGVNGVIKMTNGTTNGHHENDIVVKSEPMDLADSLMMTNGHADSSSNGGEKGRDRSLPPSPDSKLSIIDNGSNSNSPKSNGGHSSDESTISQCSSGLSRGSSGNSSIKREKNGIVVTSAVTVEPLGKEILENGFGPSKEVMAVIERERERLQQLQQQQQQQNGLDGRKSSSPIQNQNQSRSASSSPPGPRTMESTLTITKQHKEMMNGRIPSPPQNNHNNHHQHHNHHNSNGNHASEQHNLYLNGIHPPPNHLHARLTGADLTPRSPLNVSSPLVHSEIRNLTEKPDPLSVVTSTSLSFHHHSMYRINGVRPEVISGGAVTPTANNSNNNNTTSSNSTTSSNHSNNSNSPTGATSVQSRKSPTLSHQSSRSPNSSPSNSNSSGSLINGSLHSPGTTTIVAGGSLGMVNSSTGPSNHHHHVNLNRTPTVIMGEAGGVRTMLWSQPGQTIPTPPVGGMSPPTTTTPMTNGHGGHTNGYGGGGISNGHGSPVSNNNSNNNNSPPANNNHPKGGLSMERLWATEALNLSTSPNNSNSSNSSTNVNGHANNNHHSNATNNNNHHHLALTSLNNISSGHVTNSHNGHSNQTNPDDDDYEQPMICMICEDRATGLHYGIITCEGCKGFFKRTVQNRRVYTCVADGTCEITKAQRNRCQYCRFKKCIEQGMVLQAVREDRMPGGRNSGAVYNLYKVPVKYRKHKKGNRVTAGKAEKAQQQQQLQQAPPPNNPPVQSGNILKAALTSPNEVTHLRQSMPYETAHAMITELVQCDNFRDIAALQNWEELLEARGDLSDKLCQMGDSIVYRLVQWTKRLPFYPEVPVDVHTRVLTHKWHELLVLTTSAWQAMHTPGPPINVSAEEETMESLQVLQRCLQAMMGRSLTLEQLRQDVGQMVERLTYLTRAFRRMNVRIEEYVCLKVITMLQNTGTRSPEVGVIQERYVKCLRTFLEVNCPGHPNRLNDLLRTLPEVQAAAALLLESKMFYVPFLLNSALLQR